jgi:hypothetical protein
MQRTARYRQLRGKPVHRGTMLDVESVTRRRESVAIVIQHDFHTHDILEIRQRLAHAHHTNC